MEFQKVIQIDIKCFSVVIVVIVNATVLLVAFCHFIVCKQCIATIQEKGESRKEKGEKRKEKKKGERRNNQERRKGEKRKEICLEESNFLQ
jgi:hypothetical protein